MRRLFIALALLVVVAAGTLYFLGRGRVGVSDLPFAPLRGGGDQPLTTLRLYFGRPDGAGLLREDRAVVLAGTLRERLQACIRELAAGPAGDAVPSVPAATALREVFVDRWGLGYLDFDRGLLGRRRPGDYEEWLAVAALVHTVCDNFPEVREIRFMIDGQVVTSLDGYIDLEEPLCAGDIPIGPVAGGL